MNCSHVLGLIDAGPFADYPRAHLAAAWRHARQCAACGSALEAATALTTNLAALPQPAPPVDLAKAVLTCIAQIDELHHEPDAAAKPETTTRSATFERWVWATALGGFAAGLSFGLPGLSGSGLPIDVATPRLGGMLGGSIALPGTTTGTLVLAVGLGLYVAGLFVPLDGGRRLKDFGP